MSYTITKKIIDHHPYEIIEIKVIKNTYEKLEDYLTIEVGAIEILESNPPLFTIKRMKSNIGM